MKQFALVLAIIGTTVAAPWVVLDTRNDMLAMSSEVSDGAIAIAVPPPAKTMLDSVNNDESATSSAPENASTLSDDVSVPTTEQQPQADDATTPVPESELTSGLQDFVQTTVKTIDDDIQHDNIEITTENVQLPSSSSISSFLEDEIQSEDMNIKVIPDVPITPPRQNPNSIEEDEPISAVLVVSKKKHEIFSGKKSKFSM